MFAVKPNETNDEWKEKDWDIQKKHIKCKVQQMDVGVSLLLFSFCKKKKSLVKLFEWTRSLERMESS